jgi:hypothetical protein
MTINERNTRIFQGKLIDTTDINIVLRPGELSTDLTTYTLFVHDGVTPGGLPLSHGAQGPTGLSAYQLAVNNGFSGTEQQWLASLVGPKGADGAQGAGGSGGTGTNFGFLTSSTEIVIATDYLGQQSGLLGHILDIPLNTLNQQIQSGWQVIFADGQTTATVGSAYTNGDHITLNLTVPGGTLFVQPAYPITVIGTTTLGATATNVVIPGYGLVLNPDGTLSVNSATIQGLLPIYEIGGNPGITTIDNNLSVQGIITAPALTVSNFISFADGSVQTTAALSGSLGFGLQRNADHTISVNSTTIQLLLPILEISQNNTSTTVIDNNTTIHGVLGAYALTVTNAIYFPDGTSMITAATGNNGSGGGISTASVTALIANSLTNYALSHSNIVQSSTAPATTSTSTLWYDTVSGRSYVYYDSSWVDASPIATASATTSTLVNGSYHFTLGVDGTINFDPASNGKGVLQTTADLWFNANGAIYNFGATGDLTLAGGNVFFSDAIDSTVMYNSGISVSSATAYGISTGGVNGSNNLYWFEKPENAVTGLWNAIRLNSAEDAASTGSIVVSTGQFVSRKNWIYAQDGTLTLPGNILADGMSLVGAPCIIGITDTGGVWPGAIGVYTRLSGVTPPKWVPYNYNPSTDSSITYNGGWQLNNPAFPHPVYVNTGGLFNPSATWNPDTQFGLGSGNPAGAYTYNNWTFSSDGNTKFPGTIYAQASDNGSIVFSDDGSTDHGSIKVDGGHNMVINAESNYYVKRNGQDRLGITDTDTTLMAGRNLVLKSNKNSTEQVWSFNSNGSVTFPDTSVQTTAFTASSYISKATLQSIITTCTSFTEFKNAILGL